ncbi:MAG: hypothetical protein Q9165_002834 [Trypethelium subeluteriae]
MSPRARHSTVAPSQRLELPPYEDPLHALKPTQQSQLQQLQKLKYLETLNTHLRHATECVNTMAANINDRFTERQISLGKRKAKRAQLGLGEDGSDLREEEKELEAMRERVDKMTQRMEETVRKVIDSSKYVESIENGMKDVQSQSTNDAARATQRSQNQIQTRSTVVDEDDLADFEPTDPATTAPVHSLCHLYTNKLEREKDRWQTFSLRTRYANHKDYIEFRELVHDAQNPDSGGERPNRAAWFSDRAGSPAPGITRRTAARTSHGSGNGDGEGDSDSDSSDIAIARERISTKCPLTLREFEDPVTSTHCPHSFERSAILSLIKDARDQSGSSRGARVVQCPVGGCAQMLTERDLRKDPTMVRRIQRLQAAKARAAEEDSDDEGRDGGDGAEFVEEIGSEDDMDGVAGRQSRARSVKPKMEPRSSRPLRATAAAAGMSGSDTEDE